MYIPGGSLIWEVLSAWAELEDSRSVRGGGMGGMPTWSSALPASSGCQSQSAASASPGSALRSPSWWCGGHPRACLPTAAAPHTGVGKEEQEAGTARSERRRWWLPRAQQASSALLGSASLCTTISVKSICFVCWLSPSLSVSSGAPPRGALPGSGLSLSFHSR